MQRDIDYAETNGLYSDPSYNEAVKEFMLRYCCDEADENSPECLRRKKVSGKLSYITAWGQSEFAPRGNLKDYDYTEKIRDINLATLVTSGVSDLSSPLISKTLYDNIPKARWELFQESRHMPFVDETEKYLELLKAWLNQND